MPFGCDGSGYFVFMLAIGCAFEQSPMPFGCDGSGYKTTLGNRWSSTRCLQCLSAVMGVVTPTQQPTPLVIRHSLQCLSAVMGVVTLVSRSVDCQGLKTGLGQEGCVVVVLGS